MQNVTHSQKQKEKKMTQCNVFSYYRFEAIGRQRQRLQFRVYTLSQIFN